MILWSSILGVTIALILAPFPTAGTRSSEALPSAAPQTLERSESAPPSHHKSKLERTSSAPLRPDISTSQAAALHRGLEVQELLRGAPRLLARVERQPPELRRAVAARLRAAVVRDVVGHQAAPIRACAAAYADLEARLATSAPHGRAQFYYVPWDGRRYTYWGTGADGSVGRTPHSSAGVEERYVRRTLDGWSRRTAGLEAQFAAEQAAIGRVGALLVRLAPAAPPQRAKDERMLAAARQLLRVEAEACENRRVYVHRWLGEQPRGLLAAQMDHHARELRRSVLRLEASPAGVAARTITRAAWDSWARGAA